MLLNIAGFLACSVLIFYHGKKLSYYGDLISIKSGFGKVWVGLILMAAVTSLPELFISVSAVSIVGSADLAVGNLLGSCVFNLAVLSLLDALMPGQPLLTRVAQSNVLAASLGTVLLSMVGVGLFLQNEIVLMNWIAVTSLSFLIIYLISMRLLYSYGAKETLLAKPTSPIKDEVDMKLSKVIMWYVAHAVMVILAAAVLPYFSEYIAKETGIAASFMGTLFLAASSSLPEIAVSISAARIGNADMAVGNLFGSNIFNILLLSVADAFYLDGNLLKDASESNMISVFAVIIMNSIAIAGLTIRPEKKGLHYLAWDALLILAVYVFAMVFLFFFE